jgi:hypothetical protein
MHRAPSRLHDVWFEVDACFWEWDVRVLDVERIGSMHLQRVCFEVDACFWGLRVRVLNVKSIGSMHRNGTFVSNS